MMDKLIQILMAYLGSLGFNLLFNIRGRKLLIASFGGMLENTVLERPDGSREHLPKKK